ncbi:uncharacterized protein LOC109727340 isoform X2 [Ananas comosus]|uniref:Uncharacterized protein LOC109727340 isoform X2 n=2 Tax=Ananas comosus TaxID=4615 RepID=A0A6P5GYY5_ANACO|nr:uncharacterized protein LOC109727340 isoform X2 [Ananas comosus]
MSVAKVSVGSTPDSVVLERNSMKPEREEQDSLENFTRLLQGRMVSLKNVCQVSQADLPGWPLLSPIKVQLQKCEKCSREFCSSINYRRHVRVHRRSLNVDKDFPKNREYIGAFWDKLSLDEAKDILSLADVAIEEVSGSSIIRALSSWLFKPGFASMPLTYAKAGTSLLDMVHAKPSRFPLSSQELFNILDDASEKTFLCAGTSVPVQKFLFNGEAGRTALEMKNLVACTSFLLEQKLVKAWLADKAAEALRCQKLLVEEEEAAQKRQAELLEKKRMKKLRQKENKLKDSTHPDNNFCSSGSTQAICVMPSPSSPPDSDSNTPEVLLSPNPIRQSDPDIDSTPKSCSSADYLDQSMGHEMQMGCEHQEQIPSRNHPKSTRIVRNDLVKNTNYKDPKAISQAIGHKVWMQKTKPKKEEEGSFGQVAIENIDHPILHENAKVLIGSISVTLGDNNGRCNYQEKLGKSDSGFNANGHSVTLQRPVDHHENGDSAAVKEDKNSEDHSSPDIANPIAINKSLLSSGEMREKDIDCYKFSHGEPMSDNSPGPEIFSSKDAEAFLSQRWKAAIAADHVKLVLPPEAEASDCPDNTACGCINTPLSSDLRGRTILGSAENRMDGIASLESVLIISKPKFRHKVEKNCKLKYVPKQTSNV